MEPIASIFKHRKILWVVTLSDIRSRFAATLLGYLWPFLFPLLFLGLYWMVFTMIYQVKFNQENSFADVMIIFCGLIPFIGFSEALSMGVNSVVENQNLIKNTLFPIDLIPVKAVFSGSITMLVGFMMLIALYLATVNTSLWALAIIPIVVLQLFMTVGIVWFLSALNVYFRDVGQLIGLINLGLMVISPIAYTLDMVPENLRFVMKLNPLYYLIGSYRALMFRHEIPWELLGSLTLVTAGCLIVGAFTFSKLKAEFVSHV